jgi:hypothetical protein
MADPREDARDRRKAMQPSGGDRVAFVANGETRENMEQVVVNHFGSPDQGQVLIQTWVEPDWTDFEAVDIQGPSRRSRSAGPAPASPSGSRSGVELYDNDGMVPNLHASSSTVNSGDVNGTAYVQTPEAGELTTPGRPCLWFTVAFYSIRWDDDTLSSGRFLEAPGDWLNPTCLVTPASDLRAR